MKPLHLAEKKGKLLVFGGVYSNLQALTALQNIAHELAIPASNVICTGDVVGYCAQPEEVIQVIKSWGIECIAGNVELQLAEGKEDCGCDFNEGSRCDLFSKQWYPFAQSELSNEALNWAKELPEIITFAYHGHQLGVVHGSAFETAEYIFKSTNWSIKAKNFTKLEVDTIIAGHCGLPFTDKSATQQWINPGVIGMPANDGETSVWYAVLESYSNELKVSHHQLSYDHETANKLMITHQLPPAYAKTLLTGIWDNCEILPSAETNQQGKPITF